MLLPFSLKIGHVSLDISVPEQLKTESLTDEQIRSEISKSWELMKVVVNNHIDAESGWSPDPFRKDPKLKLMMFIFNALSNPEVEEKTLIAELLKTGKFSEEEAKSYIKPAVIHGMFRDLGNGLYRSTK
jgi:hypothetical protein